MNRTQKFALNSASTAINQVVVMIVGMITPRLMISTYGSQVNGLVSSLNQFIGYISLVEAGIGGAAIFSLYKPLAQNNQSAISRIVAAANKGYREAGYLFSSCIFILAFVYAVLCKTETLPFATIFPLALILGLNGCVDFFLVAGYRVLLTADQRTYITAIAGTIQTILRTIIIVVLAMVKANIVLLYLLALIPILIKVLMIGMYAKKQYGYLDAKAQPDKVALDKRWDVIYQQILGTVQMGSPTIIATVLLDLLQVSVYSVYNMVMTGVNGLLSIFISGLPAGFGELIAKKETDTLRTTVTEFEVAYYYILSIAYGITLILILPFIQIYTQGLTDVNYYNPALAVMIVLNGLLYNIKTPQSMLIVSAGMYKETRWRVTIQGLLVIVCGAIFGLQWGLAGIMLGSCISNLYRTIDLLCFVPAKIVKIDIRKTIFRMLRVFLNIGIVLLIALSINVNPTNYVQWVLYAMLFGVVAIAITTLSTWIFDREAFGGLLLRLKSILRRR